MATLRNKRKLAAVSRETPESTTNSRAQNTLDRDSTQFYISQVSEQIEGRVTKKLSKEFSRTESRTLTALSKLDEFFLNSLVRTCSVDVRGTSRNNNSENRETTGDRSSDDPCPEVRYSSHHSGHLSSPEAEDYPNSYRILFLRFNPIFYFILVFICFSSDIQIRCEEKNTKWKVARQMFYTVSGFENHIFCKDLSHKKPFKSKFGKKHLL